MDTAKGIQPNPSNGFPIEAARWIVLALAMVNRPFAERLTFEVGPWAFKGGQASATLYDAVAKGPPYDRVMKELFDIDLGDDEKPSDALLRELCKAAAAARYAKDLQPIVRKVVHGDFAGAMELVRQVAAETNGDGEE